MEILFYCKLSSIFLLKYFFPLKGMVQLCSSCNEKHSHLAEGGTAAASTSIDGRFTPSDNKSQANSESSNVRFKVNVLNNRFIKKIIIII